MDLTDTRDATHAMLLTCFKSTSSTSTVISQMYREPLVTQANVYQLNKKKLVIKTNVIKITAFTRQEYSHRISFLIYTYKSK